MATSEMNYMDIITGEIEVGVERLVGTFKIDGVIYNRYVKVIDISGKIPSSAGTSSHIPTNSNAVGIIRLTGVCGTNANTVLPIPEYHYNGVTNYYITVFYYGSDDSIVINCSDGLSNYSKGYVTIEYYK